MMSIFSKKDKNSDFFELLEDSLNNESDDITLENAPIHNAPYAITANEVLSSVGNNVENTVEPSSSPLETLKSRMKSINSEQEKENNATISIAPSEEKTPEKTLLEKCKAYTVDDSGRDVSNDRPPLYRLKSIAEILHTESQSALDDMSQKYNITFDDLGKNTPKVEEDNIVSDSESLGETTTFEKMVADSIAREKETDIVKTIQEHGIEIKEYDTSIPDISDIDTAELHKHDSDISNTGTIRFTPIRDEKFDTNSIAISSTTKPLDLGGEFFDKQNYSEEKNTTILEESAFEQYVEKNEYTSRKQNKKFIRKFSILKRANFISTFFSGLILIILIAFLIPTLNQLTISHSVTMSIIFALISFVNVLLNIRMFASLKNIFTKNCTADAPIAIASLLTLAATVCAIITQNSAYELALLLSLILFIRALSQFLHSTAVLLGFKQIAVNKQLTAIGLITDSATTFAMAKNSVEGDALIAVPRKTDFVNDYVKYTGFGTVVYGMLSTITVIATILSLLCGVMAYVYYLNVFYAFISAASIMLTTAIPTLFFIGNIPYFSANKRLAKEKAMIAGNAAAEKIEAANAVVVSSCDIFPEGSVTLHDIKVLSENNFDNVIMKAASLTKAVNSTLSPIFQQIAKTNTSYKIPDSDTVKYEDRMGISGWVDNELLFIGNRTLMQAHEIDVPSIDVDRRILQNGYFPVYVADGHKACALIIIQYNADENVVRKLRETTKLGITILVENSDPNINEEMICDYLGLYDDSVKIMSNAGVHMYRTTTKHTEECSAPAAFTGPPLAFASIINAASRMKKSNSLLTVLYVILSILGILLFVYSSFSGNTTQPMITVPLYYSAATLVVSYILYLFKKP